MPKTAPARRFKLVLLKISGEAFGGSGVNLDVNKLNRIAKDIRSVRDAKIELALVVGGGNLLRGAEVAASGMNRASADQAGMLATVINGLALQDALERVGVETRVCSALPVSAVAEPFIRRRVMRHIEKGRVPILVGGTGNPYFTTDTAAALRAKEIGADVVLKATKVDGVYTADPKKDKTATRFKKLTYMEVLQRRLKVMDSTAIAMCQDNQIPIVVFDYTVPGNVLKAALGEPIGTLVSD